MHRIAATPGGWNPDTEGVIFLEQTPAPMIILTTADTEIQTLAHSSTQLPKNFPPFRVANLLQLQQELSIDTYVDDVLVHASVIVVRLLGGRSYWSYGLDRLQEIAKEQGIELIVLPGDDRPDPALIGLCTVPLRVADRLWHYFVEGGVENLSHALQYLAHTCLDYPATPPLPQPVPQWGVYPFELASLPTTVQASIERDRTTSPHQELSPQTRPTVGILFYRAHYLAGNTKVIDALCTALHQLNLTPIPIFIPSLRDPEIQTQLLEYLSSSHSIDVLLNTTGFSLAKLTDDAPQVDFWQQLDVPVLQVILSGGSEEQWQNSGGACRQRTSP